LGLTDEESLAERVRRLAGLDWDFRDATTSYLTHSLHPYPAKFIPQIPQALIAELSSPGDTIADIFCGSGTTLVEALVNGRNAIGVDANPLACLISAAKTVRASESDFEELDALQLRLDSLIPWLDGSQPDLFAFDQAQPETLIPTDDAIAFWFEPHVVRELGIIRLAIEQLGSRAQLLGKACFSSIIVAVSKQDSDTRYVRRQKSIKPGETLKRFLRAVREAMIGARQFADRFPLEVSCRVIHADVLSRVDIGNVDLVVTSPPYPNAYSYHLYHMTRMVWLGMDAKDFKRREIGSHRKYSSKATGAATRATFLCEVGTVFEWLRRHLKLRGYACFVVGNSIIRGEPVRNDELLIEAATAHGFSTCANFTRRLQDTRKAFNPKIGKIKDEHVVIFQRR
jgi:site-specific DNA-methyltransferase (cytosine-N4-specific)